MKLLKKCTSIFLIQCLLATVAVFPMPTAGMAAQDAPQWYFSNGFDSCDDGQMPGQSIISAYNQKGNTMMVVSVPSKTDKSIQAQFRSKDDCLFEKEFASPISGKFVFETTVRIDKNQGCNYKNFTVYNSDNTTWLMFSIDNNGEIKGADGKQIGVKLPEGNFSTISVVVDLHNHLSTIYVNYKRRASDIPVSKTAFDLSKLRVHFTGISDGCETTIYVSEMKFYEGDTALTPKQIDETDWSLGGASAITAESMSLYMNNKLGFYADSPKVYAKGNVGYINEDNVDVTAFCENGINYVPVRRAAEAFGGKVTWNASSASASVIIAGNTVNLSTTSGEVTFNSKTEKREADVKLKDGTLFVSAPLFAQMADKSLFEETGIILFSPANVTYNWYDDTSILLELAASLVFERPTGARVEADLRAVHPVGSHPRLWATKADFDRIRNEVASSSIKKQWFDYLEKYTNEYIMKLELPEYGTTDGIRMRVHCDRLHDVIGYTGFMWQLTGDEKYAEHAWMWLEKMSVGSYKDWNHKLHWLDTGTFMTGFAIGYDWFYDWMNEEQRALIRQTIVEFGFNEFVNSVWYDSRSTDNWNSVISDGVITCALAIMDEESEISKKVVAQAIDNIENTILGLAPDGACYEGPSYWQLTTETIVEALSALDSATGTNYGLINSPGLAETGYYPFALAGKATLNFGNASEVEIGTLDTKELFWFANKNDDRGLANLRYKTMLDNNINPHFQEMIWCKGDPAPDSLEMGLDHYYRVTEAVTMRNNWNVNTMLFAGIHAGKTTIANGQLDTGTFVIDSFGDRFACDLGLENYGLAGVYNSKYRNRGEGHNIMVFNPDDRVSDIDVNGYARFERYETNEVSAFVTTDLTCNYPDYVDSAVRGMKLTNGRTSILLQDEVKSSNANEVYWFMHTKADVTIAEDGKSAILDVNGNRMEMKLLSDVGTLGVMDAKPLPTSPQIVGQDENKGYRKVFIHLENVKDFTVSICFTPLVYTPVGGEITYPEVTPLSEWKLDNPDEVSLGVLPTLDTIKIDGSELMGFDSDKNFYNYALKKQDSPIPVIEATGDGEVEIIKPAVWPGSVEIRISNEHFTNVYGIRFNVPPQSLADQGYTELDINEFTVSATPQPENPPESVFDNDFETRFSVQQPGWICADFGEAKAIEYASLSFYLGDQRMNELQIEVSEDGTSWTKVWQGRSSGTTTELENFKLGGVSARYIRITGTGIVNPGSDTATQGWFSPTEFKCYTK